MPLVYTQTIDHLPYLINRGEPVFNSLKKINDSPFHAALVVDQDDILVGTLTDGDLRRGLLRGYQLEDEVDKFMQSNPSILLADNASKLELSNLLKSKDITFLPLVNALGQIINIQIPLRPTDVNRSGKSAVIMAGGQGLRLRPLTNDCPKPMLSVNGKPILEIIVEQCASSGFDNLYISVNYLKEQIIDYFKDGSDWGVSIHYLIEDAPLGTAGSLQLLPHTMESPFLVLNGDVLSNINFSNLMQFHEEQDIASATICVREYLVDIPFGVVTANNSQLIELVEKPQYKHLINAGIYILDPSLLRFLTKDEYLDMTDLITLSQQADERIVVCPIHENWLDIGRYDSLKKARLIWDNFQEKSDP